MRHFVTRNRLVLVNAVVFLAAMLAGATVRAQTNPSPFLYPLVSSATPPGGPAFSLTVNGTGFVSGAVVNWNGSPRTTTFVSSSQVTAAITAADIADVGTAVITVTNPPPGGGTSNPEFFHVTYPTVGLTLQDSLLLPGPFGVNVVINDFNGDGKPDLAELLQTASGSNYAVEIFLGNGDGTFQAPVTAIDLPAGVSAFDLAVGDFNGDGKADLVGSYSDLNSGFTTGTFTLLGNGDGTFQPPLASDSDPTGFDETFTTQVADVNGDGILDLVRTCRAGVCVELGNGDGTFRRSFQFTVFPSTHSGPIRAQSVAVGDFRKNGKLDIIAGLNIAGYTDTPFAYYLVMLPGNGDGTFGPASVFYEQQVFGGLDSLTVADFDNDGNLDLAFYHFNPNPPQPTTLANSGALSIMRGNGDGTFQAPLTLVGLPEGGGPSPAGFLAGVGTSVLVPGDFNGDGHIDLAVQNAVVLLGDGNGPFSYSVVTLPSTSSFWAAGDLKGDGRLDLVGLDASYNVHVSLQSSVPDFAGAISGPAYGDVEPGETATYAFNLTSLNGFSGTIQFSASGLPPGATATFTPSTLAGAGTVTVRIATSDYTAKGTYPIIVTGTSVGITHSGGITLNVGSADERFEDFGGTVTPAFQTVIPGASTTYQISVFPLNGFESNVSLSISGLPAGATATISPTVITGGSGVAVLTITTASSTPTATYPLIVTATGGVRTHATGMNLNVGPASTDFTNFTGSITPPSQTVHAGESTSFTLAVQLLNGTGCVYVQVSGIPPAAIGHFDRSSPICGSSASTVFTVITSPQTPPGTYTIAFQGTSSGGYSHYDSVTLTVVP